MSKIETIRALPDSQQLELVKAINQLSEKAGQIDEILTVFENINQAQRQSIQALADEISSKATQALQQQLLLLAGKTDTLEKTLLKVNQSAEFLEKAQRPIQQATLKIHEAANQVQRQPWLKLMGLAVVAALLASLLTVAGMHVLSKLQQKNETQLQQLLYRATPREIELIRQIYNRPGR